jgi:hypothetical protein
MIWMAVLAQRFVAFRRSYRRFRAIQHHVRRQLLDMPMTTQFGRSWSIAFSALVILFAIAAALNMLNLHVPFFTTHAADLSGPALLYIQTRRSWQQGSTRFLTRAFGRSPEVTAGVFFFASTATEISQIFYPHGIFSGRFDPWDIVAFAVGVGACYISEKAGLGITQSETKVKINAVNDGTATGRST